MSNPYLDELKAAIYEDIDEVPARFIGMFYGDVDTGKTVFALRLAHAITSPEKTIYHVDSSQGFMSLRNHPDLWEQVRGGRIKIVTYKGQTQLNVLAAAVDAKAEEFANAGCIILDEGTAMYSKMFALAVQKRASRKDDDPFIPIQQDYMVAGNRWIDVWQKYTALEGIHFIVTGHVRDDKTPTGLQHSPAFIPYVNGVIRRDIHLIGFFENKVYEGGQQLRTVQVHGTNLAVAKSRVGGFDTYTTPPALADGIIGWLKGNVPDEIERNVETEQLVTDNPEQEAFNPDSFNGTEVE